MIYNMKAFREYPQAQHPENHHMPKAKLTFPGHATSLSGALSGCPSETLRLVVLCADAGNTAAITSNDCMGVRPKCGPSAAVNASLGYNAKPREFAASLQRAVGNSLAFGIGCEGHQDDRGQEATGYSCRCQHNNGNITELLGKFCMTCERGSSAQFCSFHVTPIYLILAAAPG